MCGLNRTPPLPAQVPTHGACCMKGESWQELAGAGRSWQELAGADGSRREKAGARRSGQERAGEAGRSRQEPAGAGNGKSWQELAGAGGKGGRQQELAGAGRSRQESAGKGGKRQQDTTGAIIIRIQEFAGAGGTRFVTTWQQQSRKSEAPRRRAHSGIESQRWSSRTRSSISSQATDYCERV